MDEGYANLVLKYVKEGARKQIDEAKKMIGEHPGREKVSTEKQWKAYESLTTENIMQLEAKHGAASVAEYIMEMEKRRRRRKE